MTQTARLYGGSLYDLAVEENLTEGILEQMKQIRVIFYENPDYMRLLSEPSVPKEERARLIDDAFGAQTEKYLVNFMKLLCERNILREYAGCCDEYIRRYNADNQIAEAQVTSAVALTDAQVQALTKKLEGISGKRVSLTCSVDPRIMGGIMVELEGKQLDGTVKGRLEGISRKLEDITL